MGLRTRKKKKAVWTGLRIQLSLFASKLLLMVPCQERVWRNLNDACQAGGITVVRTIPPKRDSSEMWMLPIRNYRSEAFDSDQQHEAFLIGWAWLNSDQKRRQSVLLLRHDVGPSRQHTESRLAMHL
jgi:hypothetical protein